ncbi:MFS transporter [Streptomyces sp. NPDC001982]|uniref:MFS transporter n=1 Tax=Streptomyces sp. NPDC001982 TaxID=3154405 RepID=UPI00332818F4
MGGQALGSVVWALVAGAVGAQVAPLAGAGLLVLCAVTVRWWPLHPATGRLDRTPVSYLPEPAPAFEPLPVDGPVQVVKTYRVPKENVPRFLDAMERVGRSRRRTGAMRWDLHCDSTDTDSYVEEFLVLSREEHLRQHSDRLTGADRGYEEAAEALVEGPPQVQHLFPPGSG